MSDRASSAAWTDEDSRAFIRYGQLFVPRREEQMTAVVALLPSGREPLRVLELCCGEGLLARRILESRPEARVRAIDGSPEMVRAACEANADSGDCFEAEVAELEGFVPEGPVDAIVSSMAVHHLDHEGKRSLFEAAHRALTPGGALVIVDLIEPAHRRARELAATGWDAEVARMAERSGQSDAVEAFRSGGWNHYALEEPDPIDRPARIADQLDWLRAAGFSDVDLVWLFAGHAVFGAFKH